MSGSPWPEHLPSLASQNHRITSPPANRYNGIAWAAGSSARWWWPSAKGFWPRGVPRAETLSAFLAAFRTLGYKECRDGALEEECEKVALFAGKDLKPTHAARQLRDGRWTSKLGPLEQIEHVKVEDVSGPSYGNPVRFMRRAGGPTGETSR